MVQSMHVPQKFGLLQDAYADEEGMAATREWCIQPGQVQSSPHPHEEGRPRLSMLPSLSRPVPQPPIVGNGAL